MPVLIAADFFQNANVCFDISSSRGNAKLTSRIIGLGNVFCTPGGLGPAPTSKEMSGRAPAVGLGHQRLK